MSRELITVVCPCTKSTCGKISSIKILLEYKSDISSSVISFGL